MIHKERVKFLNDKTVVDNPYVVYWMQSSQRSEWNHALEYAIEQANSCKKPLLVYFAVTDAFPEANERHYAFMLEGLREVKKNLEKRGIRFIVQHISPEKGALEVSSLAAMIIVDRGYLRIEREWRKHVSNNIKCPLVQVETNVLVPVESASDKEEYSAATLRRKLSKVKDLFLEPLAERKVFLSSLGAELEIKELPLDNVDETLKLLQLDRSVKRVDGFIGGTANARAHLEEFINHRLDKYSSLKNHPGLEYTSNLSPYLHFGQISPLYIHMRLRDVESHGKEDFLEELIVRRELSMNFVFYNDNYDSYNCLHQWARDTLKDHEKDKRDHLYSLEELEAGNTHDPYWNAAQTEMVKTGKMNGYMRMYWGKKILEWSRAPEEAFQTAIYLNNKYNLDGRDPNGFTGVAWCFGKHDRGWKERDIFGKIRYMNDKGLKRKFDMEKYLEKVEGLK